MTDRDGDARSSATDAGVEAVAPLPPAAATPARLLGVPGAVVGRYDPEDVIADAVAAVEPDLIVATPPDATVVEPALHGVVDLPVATPGRGLGPTTVRSADDRVLVVVAPTLDALPDRPAALSGVETDATGATPDGPAASRVVLVTDALSLSVEPHRRRVDLEGASAYVDTLGTAWLSDAVTHCATTLRPGYDGRGLATQPRDRTADTEDTTAPPTTGAETGEQAIAVDVHGAGVSTARLGVATDGEHELSVTAVYPNGAVTAATRDPERFGLRGVDGVGEARVRRLREAGLQTPEAVATADLDALTGLPTVGRSTARRLRAGARARVEDTVVGLPDGDGHFPDGEPVFVDIETDGLAASTAWLVGVLDGDAATGSYMPFREPEPGSGEHLRAFMTWLTGSAAGRPVVAWNGYRFDFPVIREQLRRHCPELVDAWTNCYRFDPLYWARQQGNAALPGRSNRLEAVAEALGWTPAAATADLDGAAVARRYVAWRDRIATADDPVAVTPPDWERLEAYCEADVRALATIYDALRTVDRRPARSSGRDTATEPGTRAPRDTGTSGSSQGSLSDFT